MQGSRALVLLAVFAVLQDRVAAASPDDLRRADAALLAADYEEALRLYDEALQDPSLPAESVEAATYLAARAALKRGDPAAARPRLESFLQRFPRSAWADDALLDLAAIASADSVDQNLRDAAAHYTTLLHQHPASPRIEEALLELGNLYVRIEEWKKADEVFRDLLRRARTDEQEVHARLLIAALFSADGNPDQDLLRALSEYEHQIFARFPKTRQLPAAIFGRAEVLRKLRRYDEAIASYKLIVERWPRHSLAPLAQSLIAYAHEQVAQFDDSRRELETVKSVGPDSELSSALSIRSAALAQKEQIQVLSNSTTKHGEMVTEFSGSVRIFHAGVEIDAELARYDAGQRLMTVAGPARVTIGEQTFSTQRQLTLDPEQQLIVLNRDVRVEPPANPPRCDGERLHLHLRTGKLACSQ